MGLALGHCRGSSAPERCRRMCIARVPNIAVLLSGHKRSPNRARAEQSLLRLRMPLSQAHYLVREGLATVILLPSSMERRL